MKQTLWTIYAELCRFMLASLRFWLPYKDMRYYHSYLARVERLQAQTGPGLWHPTSPQHILAACLGFGLLFVGQTVWLYVRDETALTPYRRFIHADVFHYVVRNRNFHLTVPAIAAMTYHFIYTAYFGIQPRAYALLCRVLDYQSPYHVNTNYAFSGSYSDAFIDAHRWIDVRFRPLETGRFARARIRLFFNRSYPTVEAVRLLARALLLLTQPFVLIMIVALGGIVGVFLLKTWEYRTELFYSGISGYADYTAHCLSVLSIIYCLGFFAHMTILLGCVGITVMTYYTLNNRLNYRFLSNEPTRELFINWHRLDRFLEADIRQFELLFIGDRLFSPALLTFMLINGPISAYLIMTVLFDTRLTPPAAIIMATLLTEEFVGIVGVHFALGRISGCAHAPAGLLVRLAAGTACKVGNFRARYRLVRAIARLHARTRYGIHYGDVGLITLRSFAKCLLLYCEFLLYFYTFIRKNIHETRSGGE